MTTENKTPILVFHPNSYAAVTPLGTYTIHCGRSGSYATFFNETTCEPLTMGVDDLCLTFDQVVQRCAAHALRLAAELARAPDTSDPVPVAIETHAAVGV